MVEIRFSNIANYLNISATKSISSIADQVTMAAVGFFSAVYVGREMGPSGLGVFAITSAIVLIVQALQNSALLEAMSVFSPRKHDFEKSKYFGFLLCLNMSWIGGITATFFLVCLMLHQIAIINKEVFLACSFALLYANFISLQQLYRRRLYIDSRPQAALAQSLIFVALVSVGFFTLSYLSIQSIPAVYIALSFGSAVICLVQSKKWLNGFVLPDLSSIREYCLDHIQYGRWVLITIPVSIGLTHGYYFLVANTLTMEHAGLLRAADTFVIPFQQLAIGVNMLLIPMASKHADHMPASQQWRLAITFLIPMVMAAIVFVLMIYMLGSNLLIWFYGEAMSEAAGILTVVALVSVAQAIAVPVGIALTSHKRPDLKFYSYIMAALVTLTIGVALVRSYGLFGAAIGVVISQSTYASAKWFWLTRHLRRLN